MYLSLPLFFLLPADVDVVVFGGSRWSCCGGDGLWSCWRSGRWPRWWRWWYPFLCAFLTLCFFPRSSLFFYFLFCFFSFPLLLSTSALSFLSLILSLYGLKNNLPLSVLYYSFSLSVVFFFSPLSLKQIFLPKNNSCPPWICHLLPSFLKKLPPYLSSSCLYL